jgi:putative spermidine/putrescine transport system permease protein
MGDEGMSWRASNGRHPGSISAALQNAAVMQEQPQKRQWQAAALLAPAAMLLLLAFATPLAKVISDSFTIGHSYSFGNYLSLFDTPVFATIVWRTVRISLITTVISLCLGYPLAYGLSRHQSAWTPLLLLMVTVPFFTSVLIRSYAWVAILGANGLINRALIAMGLADAPVKLVYNELGTLIGMVQIELPLMVLTLYSVMRRIDRTLLQAAQSLGANPVSAFWTIFFPLSRTGVVAGTSLVFTTCLGFYVTPAMLGGPGQYVITQAIEARTTALTDQNVAEAQGTLLLAAVILLMIVFRQRLGLVLPSSNAENLVLARPLVRLDPPAWLGTLGRAIAAGISPVRNQLLGALMAMTLAFSVLPILVVIPLAFSSAPFLMFPPPGFSLRWFHAYFNDPAWIAATWFSLWVSVLSGAASTAMGTMSAYALVRLHPRGSAIVYMAWASPLVLPHFVIAVSLYYLLASLRLIGNPLTFIAAFTVLGLPYTLLVMAATIQRLDQSLEQAAATLGASPFRVWTSILIPLLRPALTSSFIFAFLVGFDDLVVSLFLSSPRAYTLSIRMWDDIRQEISPRIAAVAVVFFAVALTMLALAIAVQRLRAACRFAKDRHQSQEEMSLEKG